MKYEEPQAIGDILKEFLKIKDIAMAAAEGSVRETWEKVAGKYISESTSDAFIRHGVLTISFTRASVRAEVMMNRKYYQSEINKALGGNYVKSIRFL